MRNQFRGGVQPFPLRLEMTVQRGEKTALRRSMIVPRPATIVQPGETIVQRVETTVPRHQVYRLLRAVDRDGWLREANEPVSYQPYCFRIKDKRFARVAKWKADAAAARERTAHFHQWNQRRQSAFAGKLKIEGSMIISFVKHLCPAAGVETTRIAMQGNNMVPTRPVDRIENPHLQQFAGCLRLDERIIARDGRPSKHM